MINLKTASAIGGVIAAVVIVGSAYVMGRSAGWDAHVVICERDKQIQQSANDLAAELAERRYREAADIIHQENERLADANAMFDAQAELDADARQCGLSASSVQRINAIR